MRKGSCSNCINKECDNSNYTGFENAKKRESGCCDWTNYFGKAIVTSVYITEFEHMSSIEREAWAVRDGFSCFNEADMWFSRAHHDSEWKSKEWAVILFNSNWN